MTVQINDQYTTRKILCVSKMRDGFGVSDSGSLDAPSRQPTGSLDAIGGWSVGGFTIALCSTANREWLVDLNGSAF